MPYRRDRRAVLTNACFGALSLALGRPAAGHAIARPMMYVGCYTQTPAAGAGIHVCRLDRTSGRMEVAATVRGDANPSFLAIDRRRGRLFAVNETDSLSGGGAVAAYALDGATGGLRLLNRQPAGPLPCHVSVHPDGLLVAAASYLAGSAALFRVAPDGSLAPALDVVRHTGSSVHPVRQKGPRAHAAVFDPAGRFLFVPDLGVDRVFVYRLDPREGRLAPNGTLVVAPGSGPRHLVFHRSRRLAYLVNELSSTISVCRYDPFGGRLEIVDTVSTLPDGYTGENYCAEIRVHPSGTFLYASNRGHDSIVGFAIDRATGGLSKPRHTPSGGSWPRSFAVESAGRWLVAANQKSDTVVAFRIDQRTGELVPAGAPLSVVSPAFVGFSDG